MASKNEDGDENWKDGNAEAAAQPFGAETAAAADATSLSGRRSHFEDDDASDRLEG